MVEEALIGITAAARQIGLSHSTLSRQVKLGQVRSHGGKVKLSEVLYDRDRNIDKSIWMHRSKGKQPKSGQYVPLSSDLIQDLGRLLGSLSDDPVDVGTDCIMIGMEMMEEEARRLRASLKQPKTSATSPRGSGPDLRGACLRIGDN